MATRKTSSTAKATGTAAARATTARKSPAKAAAAKPASKTAKTTAKAAAKAPAKAKAAAAKPAAKTAAAKAGAGKTAAKPAAKAAKTAKTAPAKTAAKAPAKAAKAPTKSRPAAAKAPARSAARTAAGATRKAAATEKKPAPKAAARPKARAEKLPFKVNDFVVYPTHGVGKITALEDQEVAGMTLSLFVIEFDKEKLTVRVPVNKAQATGMRQLASPDRMKTAMTTLKGRARIKRTMWSRRAQEYEAKINSGDPIAIAEVVRDLHRSEGQPEQSYSERQIYEAAVERLSRELAAVEGLDDDAASEKLHSMLRAA